MFSYAPDSNILYAQFKTGQIDYAGYYGIASHYYQEATKLQDRQVYKTDFAQIEGIVLNYGNPLFQDKAVRQAMYFGLNKTALVDLVYYGIPTEAESFLPMSSWAFNPDLPKHVFDLAAANKVLDEAGWTKGADGVRTKGDLRLRFTIATVAGVPEREQILQLIQQDWQKIGIAMQIRTMPSAVVYGDYYTKSQFDCLLAASTYGTGADPDPTQRFSSTAIPVQGGSGANYYQYKNPEVDRLLQVGQTSFKREERKAAYYKIQSLIREDLAFLPICNPKPVEGTKAKLTGFRSNSNYQSNCWNVGSWRWKA